MDKMPDYTSKRFLVVDDQPFMIDMIERMLKQCGKPSIVKAPDGKTALVAVRDAIHKVDCIISDCNMKPINGLQLLQAIRVGLNPNIPRDQAFIMLTGHGDTDVVTTAVTLDVNGYLVKPVSPDKLVQSLQRVFSNPMPVKEVEYYRAIKLPGISTLDSNLDGTADDRHKNSA